MFHAVKSSVEGLVLDRKSSFLLSSRGEEAASSSSTAPAQKPLPSGPPRPKERKLDGERRRKEGVERGSGVCLKMEEEEAAETEETEEENMGEATASVRRVSAANKRTTICAVCRIESDNHHIHYGALACFSCRAFFRRAHNRGGGGGFSDGNDGTTASSASGPDYVCKKEGRCDVTAKNRKKCQRCRYDRCLAAG